MSILEAMQTIFLTVIGISLGCLGVLTGMFLYERLREIKEGIPVANNVIIDSIFDIANSVVTEAVYATVGKLEQIVGKDLRRLIKEGRATKDDLYALAGDAYKEVLEIVSPEVIKDLERSIGNVELYIRNIIETEVLKLKSEINP